MLLMETQQVVQGLGHMRAHLVAVTCGQENMLRKREFGLQWLQSRDVKPNKGMESLCSQRRPEALGCLA